MLDTKKADDNERYVWLTQMEHYKLLQETTSELATVEKKAIVERYPDFFSEGMKALRRRLSKGLRNRMHTMYARAVETCLSDKDKINFKRYVYHCMEQNLSPDKVLTIKSKI
jgi:hypothetical protein